MTRYRYEIDSKKAIRVWDDDNPNEQNAPFFYQPDWPNATPWSSKAEAENWVQLFIESLDNPESEFVPGDSPEEPKRKRPQQETEKPESQLLNSESETEKTEAESEK